MASTASAVASATVAEKWLPSEQDWHEINEASSKFARGFSDATAAAYFYSRGMIAERRQALAVRQLARDLMDRAVNGGGPEAAAMLSDRARALKVWP